MVGSAIGAVVVAVRFVIVHRHRPLIGREGVAATDLGGSGYGLDGAVLIDDDHAPGPRRWWARAMPGGSVQAGDPVAVVRVAVWHRGIRLWVVPRERADQALAAVRRAYLALPVVVAVVLLLLLFD